MGRLEWNLDKIYIGIDSIEYKEDKEKLQKYIDLAKAFPFEGKEDKVLLDALKLKEDVAFIAGKMANYLSLLTAVNVDDINALEEQSSIQVICQDFIGFEVSFARYVEKLDIDALVSQSAFLKKYEFVLKNTKQDASHLLSLEEELLYAKLKMVSSDSWEMLQSSLTSNLMVECGNESISLSEARARAYHQDKEVRYHAYMGELKAYEKIKDSIAMALNNIKREANIMASMRGYSSVLETSLEKSHMKKETLDAMMEAIREECPHFRKYYKAKANALGYTNGLPFYELFAPMGKCEKTYTFDEAKDEVLGVYKSFSDKLYKLGYRAFTEEWIDALPHEGKEGGAFDCGFPQIKESRVMTNFSGSLSDVSTLAHELGHAYHDSIASENDILNWDYPMPLAETASILCETLMAKKLYSEVQTKEEKIAILENSIQGDSQCIIDIYSRYLFESKVCNTKIEKPLSSEEMCALMLEAQDESYGDGLDKEYRHPYMWLCKGHYYSVGYNFYNWPYAFGLLYARGLYAKYLENKEAFVKKYDEMLKNTCIMNVEDVALCMGIDVTKKEFWKTSLKTIEDDIDELIELLK